LRLKIKAEDQFKEHFISILNMKRFVVPKVRIFESTILNGHEKSRGHDDAKSRGLVREGASLGKACDETGNVDLKISKPPLSCCRKAVCWCKFLRKGHLSRKARK